MMDTVSVIVPAYNTEKYINKCIESLMAQSYSELEIILINDGSNDNTLSSCRKFESEDKRIHVIDKPNTGVSDCRNIGIRQATGKYIVFVDSDDYVSSDYVSTLVLMMERDDIQLACIEYYLANEDGSRETEHESILQKKEAMKLKADEAVDLLNENKAFQGYLWNKIFIKDTLVKNNIFFDTRIKIWEDMLFCLKYLLNIDRVAYMNLPLYYYVQRSSSAMGSTTNWNGNTHEIALEEMWTLTRNKPGLFHDYIRDFYANDLVGRLGKGELKEKESIKRAIKVIELLEAKLTIKHRVKITVLKFFKIFN